MEARREQQRCKGVAGATARWNSKIDGNGHKQAMPSDGFAVAVASAVASATKTKDQIQPLLVSVDFSKIWNENCGKLPRVSKMTPTRQKRCKTRSGEVTEEDFRQAVKLCASTPFLLGESDRGWKADFDWLINSETNIRKVLEGKYERGANGNRPGNPKYTEFHSGEERAPIKVTTLRNNVQ